MALGSLFQKDVFQREHLTLVHEENVWSGNKTEAVIFVIRHLKESWISDEL